MRIINAVSNSLANSSVTFKILIAVLFATLTSDFTFAKGDTLKIGHKRFSIEPSTKAEFEKIPSFKFDTSEKKNLARDSRDVKRNGDTLFFKLGKGKFATLVNNYTDGEPYAKYFYEKTLKDINCYYITGAPWEGDMNVLINKTTGDTTWLAGEPIISPNKKLIICAGYSDSGEALQGFELYEINNNKISIIGELNSQYLPNWAPQAARWFDDTTLLVERRIELNTAREPKLEYIRMSMK